MIYSKCKIERDQLDQLDNKGKGKQNKGTSHHTWFQDDITNIIDQLGI